MRLRLVDVPRLALQRTTARRPRLLSLLRRLDGRLIDVGAANAAKDYEGGYFFADFAPLFGLGMERTPGRGPADDGIERSLATAIGAAGHCKGRQEACMGHFLLVWDTGAIVSS